jgi:two-component system, cell cycle sensor histidine kinase and response regulator CckA
VNQAQPASELNSSPLSIMEEISLPRDHGTILLVEDEAFVREITCEILENAGYRVLKTRNAAEAWDAFSRYKAIVRLLLTDVVLPGRNGRDLASDLRAMSPHLRTIFISGYPENAVTKNGIPEDGTFYLPKPFSMQSLTRTVRKVLQPAD